MSTPKRALITGVNGFTGQYVSAAMVANGYEVYGFGNRPSTLANYSQLDLSDVSGLRALVARVRPSVVVHLAGLAFVVNRNAAAFYEINTVGTRNLLEALAQEADSLDCVLLASSANVYGNASEGTRHESDWPNPANDYAVSKLAMEHMARLWSDKLPIVITRPFNYTGIGQGIEFLLPKIVRHFRNREAVIELGNLDVHRDFSDVRAVASAYSRLLAACPSGQTVNVCSGRTYSLRQILEIAGKIAGYEIEVRTNPAYVRANEVRSLMGSADRLREIIGEWESPDIRTTLEWMLHSTPS